MTYNALAPQQSNAQNPFSDLAAINYQTTAIPAGLAVVLDTTNQLGQNQPSATYWESLGIAVKLPVAGSPASGSFGITAQVLNVNQTGSVHTNGILSATAAGTISAANLLSICVTAGKLGWLQVAVSGDEIFAQALQSATDGTQVLVRVFGSVALKP